MEKDTKLEVAYFAMGCFWGPDYEFSQLSTKGVKKVTVGYMGGDDKKYPDSSYEQVCSGNTGHAETVKIEFNPQEISYETLLKLFWNNHDPTQLNKQGPDTGNQYRSIIFYTSEEQKKKAEKTLRNEQKRYDRPITTQILPAIKFEFWQAEEYHQKYITKTGRYVC